MMQSKVSPSRPLASLLSEEPAAVDQVAPIFVRVLRLVDSIHRQGLQHDSLTPVLIKISADGQPEIGTRVKAEMSGSETVAASDGKYALPESFWAGSENTACAVSDSYALGFIFYEIFLGESRFRDQFPGMENNKLPVWLGWHADRSRRLIPLADLLPNFPRPLSKLIEEMTEKETAQRAADFSKLLYALAPSDETTFKPSASLRGDESGKTQPMSALEEAIRKAEQRMQGKPSADTPISPRPAAVSEQIFSEPRASGPPRI